MLAVGAIQMLPDRPIAACPIHQAGATYILCPHAAAGDPAAHALPPTPEAPGILFCARCHASHAVEFSIECAPCVEYHRAHQFPQEFQRAVSPAGQPGGPVPDPFPDVQSQSDHPRPVEKGPAGG